MMKPLREMTNEELADLVEYVGGYYAPTRKTGVDIRRAASVLRGESSFPEGFSLFSRSDARELMGQTFAFSLYEQLIDRLQPPSLELNEAEIAALEEIAENGTIDPLKEMTLNMRKKIAKGLFDMGFIEDPIRYCHGEGRITAEGEAFLAAKRSVRGTKHSFPR